MRAVVLGLLVAGLAQAQGDEGRGVAPQPDARWKPNKPLLVAGGVSLGVLYLANVAISINEQSNSSSFNGFAYFPPRFDALCVPFAGPFIALGNYRNSTEAGTVLLLIADGLAQLAGLTLFVIGLVGEQNPERAPWLLAPGAAGAPAGATFTLRLP